MGFKVVFEKGDAIIEKTYDREQLQLTHRVYDESFEQLNKKKGLKALNKLAGKGNLRNLGITGAGRNRTWDFWALDCRIFRCLLV